MEQRLEYVTRQFGCRMAAYAVMSNHLHVVVRMCPEVAATWSAEGVTRRWLALYPGTGRVLLDGTAIAPDEAVVAARMQDATWVAARRERLSNLSWFMRRTVKTHIPFPQIQQHLSANTLSLSASPEGDCTEFVGPSLTSLVLISFAVLSSGGLGLSCCHVWGKK